VVTTNVSLEIESKLQLRKVVNEIDQAVTAKLDHLEQAARDLLQIVRWATDLLKNSRSDTKVNQIGACMGLYKRGGEFKAS
jgi:hypothetical protein